MTRPMPDSRETLARIRAQADAATTEGPWWTNQYSDEWEVCGDEDTEGNPFLVASEVCREDAEFIAAARTNVPRLVDALVKVLNLHFKAQPIPAAYGTQEGGNYCVTCAEDWPCPTVSAITQALEGETNE